VEGETTIPSSICIFGVSGGRWNLIDVPQAILELPKDVLLAALPELMRGYLMDYGGSCPFFGKATGFRFARLLDYFQFERRTTHRTGQQAVPAGALLRFNSMRGAVL
jgi:hypothetical protein